MAKFGFLWIVVLAGSISCNGKSAPAEATAADPATEEIRTPVTVMNVEYKDLTDSIELNATSTFLQSSYVRSTAVGYVKTVNVKPGELVGVGKPLFIIETKESLVIGNSISRLDSSFKFSGMSTVRSSSAGYVTQLNHQPGDYVQDGEQLAVISDINSFVFLLNLPYELRPFVLNKRNVDLVLPDATHLTGVISSVMPVVDSLSQTQPVVIKVSSRTPIPQNLIAKVRIIKNLRSHAQTLPRSAILSDEAQTSFWVMKLIDSSTAVKTPVRMGLEQHNTIEILDPMFSKDDRIVIAGNYGLPDTAKVIVQKQ
ncbi:HlyD family efflux transporter periplasmic adaptor subunit [Flavitalea sp. BT771]|uniref:efflux RND transporter periplasmic adaptor subunit n=1 Tax=Flavitalea sp. BT771 TaxID=3063329 RepID=UPI0026E20CD4|nr:HlyD family efflux transporter periplasmic adaptor subunit [Flavitalea sp. BT771]MDO6432522.1 HlyD family efflux transporter periplasmic adaptor subunit [Flavitalea sp. BT771]MDV6221431.1 HlyD family efflux transporter periplasmic adaptor subunit [Flavitalea sp. BT771]